MTPQSNFMVAAPIAPDREDALRVLLASMNLRPGVVDPNNALVPFARFDRLHVARFVILHDETLGDLAQYGGSFPNPPVWLVFLGDCDGPADSMLAELANAAGDGLTQIFRHCTGFDEGRGLLGWMQRHSVTPATQYINWVRPHGAADPRGGGAACSVARAAATGCRGSRSTVCARDPSPAWCRDTKGWSLADAARAHAAAMAGGQDRQPDHCAGRADPAAAVIRRLCPVLPLGTAPPREVRCSDHAAPDAGPCGGAKRAGGP